MNRRSRTHPRTKRAVDFLDDLLVGFWTAAVVAVCCYLAFAALPGCSAADTGSEPAPAPPAHLCFTDLAGHETACCDRADPAHDATCRARAGGLPRPLPYAYACAADTAWATGCARFAGDAFDCCAGTP